MRDIESRGKKTMLPVEKIVGIAKIKEGIIFLYDKVMNGHKPYYEKYLTYRNELKG